MLKFCVFLLVPVLRIKFRFPTQKSWFPTLFGYPPILEISPPPFFTDHPPPSKMLWSYLKRLLLRCQYGIVRKGVLAPLPLLRHQPLNLACPLFKIFVFPPLCSAPPLLRYFRQFPNPYATSSCPNMTNQPSLV